MRDEAELACDARVVRAFPDGRLRYAEALINVCEHQARPVPPAPALGIGGSRAARTLEARLQMILRDPIRPPTRWAVPLALILLGLSLPTWTRGQQDPPQPVQPAEPVNPPAAAIEAGSIPAPVAVVADDPAPPVVEAPEKPVPPALASTPVKLLKAQRATQVAEVARVEAVRDKVRIELNNIKKLYEMKSHAISLTEVFLHTAELRIAEAAVAREQSKIAEIDAQLSPDDPIAAPSNPAVFQARRAVQLAEVAQAEAMRDKAQIQHDYTARLSRSKTVSSNEVSLFLADLKIAEAGVAREQGKLAEIDAQINPDDPVAPRPNLAILQARRDAQAAEVARVEAERDLAGVQTDRNTALIEKGPDYVSQEERKTAQFKLVAAEATVAREKARLAEADALLAQAKSAPTTTGNPGPDSPRTLADWRDQVELLDSQIEGKRDAVVEEKNRQNFADQEVIRIKALVDRNAVEPAVLERARADRAARIRAVGVTLREFMETEVQLKQAKNRLDQEEARIKHDIQRARDRLEWSTKMREKGYVSSAQVAEDRLHYLDMMSRLDPSQKLVPDQSVEKPSATEPVQPPK